MGRQRCLKHVKLDSAAKVQELSHESSSKLSTTTAMRPNYHLTRSRSGRLTRPSKSGVWAGLSLIISRQNSIHPTDLRYMGLVAFTGNLINLWVLVS